MKMALESKPEPAWAGLQIVARGYSSENGNVVVAFLFREQYYEVRMCAGLIRYRFGSQRAAFSFASELCDEQP
jgi:hypothetical protein